MERPFYIATATLTDAWVRIDEYGLGCEYHADTPDDWCAHIISWEESFELVGLGAGRRKIWCMDHQSERDGLQARREGVYAARVSPSPLPHQLQEAWNR